MDSETLNLLKTVCVAGRAGAGFDGQTNARLEDLAQSGLLQETTNPPGSPMSKPPRRSYRPTEKGRALVRMSETGAA